MNIGYGASLVRGVTAMAAIVLLSLALVTPVLGGVDCSLQATVGGGSATEVDVGEEVLIEGFGFPPNADVEVTYSVEGTTISSEMVTADGTGLFETTVVPQPGEEGLWTVTADVPKECTAETGFLVIGAAATPAPTPAATPAQGELPDVATAAPHGPSELVIVGVALVAAAVWLPVRRLARLVR